MSGGWMYRGKLFTPDMVDRYVGMVYKITDETNGKMYIGKKLFTKSKTYQKNLKKKRMRVESDWQTYTGSSDALNEQIEDGATIKKEIIHLCTSKGWMTYLETKEIIMSDAILSDEYYNTWFSARVRKSHLK